MSETPRQPRPVRSGQVTVRAIRDDGTPGREYVIEADARPWAWGGRARHEQLIAWDVNYPQKIRRVDEISATAAIARGWAAEVAQHAADYPIAYTFEVGKIPGYRDGRPVFILGANAKRVYDAFFREEGA